MSMTFSGVRRKICTYINKIAIEPPLTTFSFRLLENSALRTLLQNQKRNALNNISVLFLFVLFLPPPQGSYGVVKLAYNESDDQYYVRYSSHTLAVLGGFPLPLARSSLESCLHSIVMGVLV